MKTLLRSMIVLLSLTALLFVAPPSGASCGLHLERYHRQLERPYEVELCYSAWCER